MKHLREAITSYCKSTYELADILHDSPLSRSELLQVTKLTPSKLDWLRQIGKVKNRYGLLPEHVYEASQADKPWYWLQAAVADGLTPIELRRRIRDARKQIKEDKPIKTAQWVRNLMLAEREMSEEEFNAIVAKEMIERIQKLISSRE